MHDVIVVGGGPAGLSCALECVDSALDVVVVEASDRIGGQLSVIPTPIRNVATGSFANGQALCREFERVADELLAGRVITERSIARAHLERREIETSDGVVRGRTLFLATGSRLRTLEVAIPRHLTGDVLYRSRAHQPDFAGRRVCIVGGGDSAVLTAIELSSVCSSIALVARSPGLTARPDLVADITRNPLIHVHTESTVKGLIGGERLEAIRVSTPLGDVDIQCATLIVQIGYQPNTEVFVDQLSHAGGYVDVDQSFQTSVRGVFAGGDIVRPGYARIAFAMGSGVMAAKAIRRFLGHHA